MTNRGAMEGNTRRGTRKHKRGKKDKDTHKHTERDTEDKGEPKKQMITSNLRDIVRMISEITS